MIGIIGLGYVGFPLACLFARKHKVIGFDRNERRVGEILQGTDSTGEVPMKRYAWHWTPAWNALPTRNG